MKKLNIYIIRHGEKAGDEGGLTKRGKAQVSSLAKKLGKLKITKIYSSDLQRCKETAEIIKKTLKLPIKYEKALREVPSKVKEQPKKYKKEIEIVRKFWNKMDKARGNILLVSSGIVRKFWNKMDKARGNILLVSSGIVNRILLSFALEINPARANFMQYPTGLTRIEKVRKKERPYRYRVWHINDTSHLSDKLRVVQRH